MDFLDTDDSDNSFDFSFENEDEFFDMDEEDEDEVFYNLYYEPEENSLTKYNLVFCLPRNINSIYPNEEMSGYNIVYIRYRLGFIKLSKYIKYTQFHKITECIYLENGVCIAIDKTFWLRIIQKKWKKICKERKLCLQKRMLPNSLFYRQIHGKWNNDCSNYPSIKGMLYDLRTR